MGTLIGRCSREVFDGGVVGSSSIMVPFSMSWSAMFEEC